MKNELIALYNTMSLIETKGESTIRMSSCLQLVKRLISELNAQDANMQGSDEGGESNEFHDNEPNN